MARLRHGTQTALSEGASLRLRAAWLYYNHGLTQKEIAERLGLGRTTVVRLLDEALKRGEVRIWIEEGDARSMALALDLERRFGLDEAVVVPAAPDPEGTARAVGLALGRFLSETLADGMTIGIGWGRTLTASLASFRPPRLENVRVMSLLGGAIDTHFVNPVEFAWRMAGQIGAECYLFPAPLVVDSAETRRRLIELCGLDRLYRTAASLDLAVLSVGDIGGPSASLSRQWLTDDELAELVARDCVGDVLCSFIDKDGATVDHPVNGRVMSIDLDIVAGAGHVLIACGGASRAVAMRAAIRRLGCNTLVTDETAAEALLALGP